MDTIAAFIILTCLLIARKIKYEGLVITKKGNCIAYTVIICILGLFLTLLCMGIFSSYWWARVIIMHIGYVLISFVTYKIFITHTEKKDNASSEDKYKSNYSVALD